MTQPRDLNGRFRRGGGNNNDPLQELFERLPWWGKILMIAGAAGLMVLLYISGYILVFIVVGFALAFVLNLIASMLS